ncbi:MAG: TraR/DksA family transcriptional regulator [bacterium]|jgi:DnaK suppressor protein
MPSKTVKKMAAKKPTSAKKVKPVAKKVALVPKKAVKPAVKATVRKAAPAPAPRPSVAVKPKGKSPFDAKSLSRIQDMLIKMRDRLTGQITTISDDSLKYKDDGSSEDRTDDFDREFALNLVSSEHDAIFEIDLALRRIGEGVYGLCDACGCAVEKARLHALPFARMCVKCQSETEKGRTRFRPFGETLAQGVEQAPEVSETEEAE